MRTLAFRSQPGLSRWIVPMVVIAMTIAAFFPALQNGFVNWDDDKNLIQNPYYRGLTSTQLHWMFTTLYMGHYQPLSWVTFGLDYLLWGMEPFGYHLTSLLLHSANAGLFYLVSLRLISLAASVPVSSAVRMAAGFAALIFGIHPLRVESVVWVTERRDVLSAFFLLIAVLLYLRAATMAQPGPSRWRWIMVAVLVYGLSLLSKASGMTLPVLLMVFDIYPLRRLGGGPGKWFDVTARTVWREKMPFLLLGLATAVAAYNAQLHAGALRVLGEYSGTQRLAQASFGVLFYLRKTVVPVALSPLYQIPQDFDPGDWAYVLSGLGVFAVSIGLFILRQRWPAGLAIWITYLVILAPVLGIVQSGPQLVADRYSYLACLGWAVLSGAAVHRFVGSWASGRIGQQAFILAVGLGAGAIVVLGGLTWRQTQVWHDSERLWRHVLALDPQSYMAHDSLAVVLEKEGRREEALLHYRQALKLNPRDPITHNNIGLLLARQGNLEEAISHYRKAIDIKPDYANPYYNLGLALGRQGKLEQAMEQYRRALRINPLDPDPYNDLGVVLAMRGELPQAIKEFRQALTIDPGHAKAQYNLARILANQGQVDEAIGQFRRALQLEPQVAEIHQNLARALAQQGRKEEAVYHYEEAIRIMRSRREAGPPQ